jgi:hypothetical protein
MVLFSDIVLIDANSVNPQNSLFPLPPQSAKGIEEIRPDVIIIPVQGNCFRFIGAPFVG